MVSHKSSKDEVRWYKEVVAMEVLANGKRVIHAGMKVHVDLLDPVVTRRGFLPQWVNSCE